MKRKKMSLSILAVLAAVIAAPGAFAQQASQASTASILFMRTNYRAVDSSHDTVLYRVNPAGGTAVRLTPVTYHVDYRGGSWSPGGGSVVYEQAPQATPNQSQLYVSNRQGGSMRAITSGAYNHQQAAWGRGGTIAFVTNENGGEQCLSAVRSGGTGQHTVFCPPRTPEGRAAMVMSTPQWTLKCDSVYIEVGNYGPGLDPQWISRVYRVNVSTGHAVKLTEQTFGSPNTGSDSQTLTISPDGTHGVYGDQQTDMAPMMLVDFLTGTRTTLPAGTAPRYSRDGHQVAFIRLAATTHYGRVFVMNADGSNVHPAIAKPGANASYSIADWSADSSRLLVNKVGNDRLLQIVRLATGGATTVTRGTAYKGAWFQP